MEGRVQSAYNSEVRRSQPLLAEGDSRLPQPYYKGVKPELPVIKQFLRTAGHSRHVKRISVSV